MKTALSLAGAMLAACAPALVLDDFTTGPYSVRLQSGSDSAMQAGSMIGGDRQTVISVQSNPFNQYLGLVIANGVLASDSGTSLDASTLVSYGATADLNANLFGYNAFEVHFMSNDLPLTLSVTLFTSTGDVSETVQVAVPNGLSFDVTVPYSLFTAFSAFGDVDRIAFGFETPRNGDFAITGIEAVPEPGTMLALGLGVAGLMARRRK